MAHILIDGYNLIAKMEGIGGNLEAQRERLIRLLGRYRTDKTHVITLVFDGEKGGGITEGHERVLGINVTYSRLGEKADDIIKRMVRAHEEEYTVITSDREVASYSEGLGHTAIPSEDFIPKLLYDFSKEAGIHDQDEGERKILTTRKKGNPRKLSKAARRRKQKLGRL